MNHSNFSTNFSEGCPEGKPVEYLSMTTIIVFDIIYIIIIITGLTGNIMTCAATILQKSMRRSIHLYVFSLAISDLLVLMFYIPNEMMRMANHAQFMWGHGMCVLTNTVLPVGTFSTVFTILAISSDRARGILRPFEWRADSKGSATIGIPLIWVVSISIAVPVMMHAKLIPWNCGLVCTDTWPSQWSQNVYWHAMFILTFCLPLIIIFVLNTIMIFKTKELTPSERVDHKRVIKMMISIVAIFTICTGSQHFYFFFYTSYQSYMDENPRVDGLLFFGSNLLVSVQSACNPILYSRFRKDFNVAYRGIARAVGNCLYSYTGRVTSFRGNSARYSSLETKHGFSGHQNGTIVTLNNSSFHHDQEPCATQLPSNIVDSNNCHQISSCVAKGNNDNNLNIQSLTNLIGKHKHDSFYLESKSNNNSSTLGPSFAPYFANAYSDKGNFVLSNNLLTEKDTKTSSSDLELKEELQKISQLLNEIKDSEIIDRLNEPTRNSLNNFDLNEKRKSRSDIVWLQVLHLLRGSKETDL